MKTLFEVRDANWDDREGILEEVCDTSLGEAFWGEALRTVCVNKVGKKMESVIELHFDSKAITEAVYDGCKKHFLMRLPGLRRPRCRQSACRLSHI